MLSISSMSPLKRCSPSPITILAPNHVTVVVNTLNNELHLTNVYKCVHKSTDIYNFDPLHHVL